MAMSDINMPLDGQNYCFTFAYVDWLCEELVSTSVDDVTPRDGAISILSMKRGRSQSN